MAVTSPQNRYAFHAVHVKRENKRAIAETSNSKILLRVSWDDADADTENEFDVLLDTNSVRSASTAAGNPTAKAPSIGTFDLAEKNVDGRVDCSITTKLGNVATQLATIDGLYPDTAEIIPDHNYEDSISSKLKSLESLLINDADYTCVCLDPTLLATLCTAIAKIGTSEESRGVDIFLPLDPKNPVLIRNRDADRPRCEGVIMPLDT